MPLWHGPYLCTCALPCYVAYKQGPCYDFLVNSCNPRRLARHFDIVSDNTSRVPLAHLSNSGHFPYRQLFHEVHDSLAIAWNLILPVWLVDVTTDFGDQHVWRYAHRACQFCPRLNLLSDVCCNLKGNYSVEDATSMCSDISSLR
jgi:hypothetical protein